jgi:hypothetical protein
LSGTVTSSGDLTLGGTLDLSAPPAIGGTTANTIRGTTITATTGFVGTNFDAAGSGGGALRTNGGSNCLQWGGGGGVNVTVDGPINMNGANAAIQMNPTGTGTVSIAPAGALTVNPTTASTMNNVAIGGTTPLAGTFTDLRVNNTISLAGSTGTAGYVLTSNGASAPTWQAAAAGLTITDDTTTNATRYITFTSATTGTITGENVASTKLQFNPSTGTLTATAFSGDGSGLTGVGGFPAGTRMIFAQDTAPTGWTKDTTNYNNHAIRIVTGTAGGTGGTVDFTTAFASQTPTGSVSISAVSGSAGATTLSTPQIPSHTHDVPHAAGDPSASSTQGFLSWSEPHPGYVTTTSTGGGGSHTHPFSFSSGSGTFTGNAINLAVKYLDVITATKN